MLKIAWAGKRIEPGLVVLGWGISIAALTLAQIFQGHLTPQQYYGGVTGQFLDASDLFYLEVLAVSAFAGLVINDAERGILSWLGSYVVAGLVTFFVLSLPTFTGTPLPSELVSGAAVTFTFTALFPIPLVAELGGTIIGLAIAERYVR